MKDHIWKIIGVVAIVAIGGSIIYSGNISSKANEGVVFEAHVKGNPDAAVTLTEYSDFQCPACAQFYTVIEELLAEKGDSIRFEYKHFPLISIHQFAVPAGKAAEAAGQQGQFFEMHNKLFENQDAWSNSPTPQAFFSTYAEELGLDMNLFKQHMRASVIDDKIKAEFNEARELGLTGTPSFFLNGARMQFETYQDFVDQIDAAIAPSSVGEGDVPSTATSPVGAEPEVRFGF